jgi:hypothetical protein
MRVFLNGLVLSAATVGVVFAGATMDRSVVSVVAEPGGGCSTNCGVGAFGTANSENAQGGYFKREESRLFPGSSVRSAGTEDSGLLRLNRIDPSDVDAAEGSLIGHADGPTSNSGRVTGDLVVQDPDTEGVELSCSGHCDWQEPEPANNP